uniref:Uncharacterized protein n=1 Tax=Arundo donax TaxID=35708 RepID=A0A0A9BVY2_ARUDO
MGIGYTLIVYAGDNWLILLTF